MTAADRIRDYLDALAVVYESPRNVAIHRATVDEIEYLIESDDLRAVLTELAEAREKLRAVDAYVTENLDGWAAEDLDAIVRGL